MCQGKQKFSKKEAHLVLKHARECPKRWRREKRSYFCEECNAWHVTSKDFGLTEIIPFEDLKYQEDWIKLMEK